MTDEKIRLAVTVVIHYEATPEHYGTPGEVTPLDMAAIDQEALDSGDLPIEDLLTFGEVQYYDVRPAED